MQCGGILAVRDWESIFGGFRADGGSVSAAKGLDRSGKEARVVSAGSSGTIVPNRCDGCCAGA